MWYFNDGYVVLSVCQNPWDAFYGAVTQTATSESWAPDRVHCKCSGSTPELVGAETSDTDGPQKQHFQCVSLPLKWLPILQAVIYAAENSPRAVEFFPEIWRHAHPPEMRPAWPNTLMDHLGAHPGRDLLLPDGPLHGFRHPKTNEVSCRGLVCFLV